MAKRAVSSGQKEDGDYADWVIVVIHSLRLSADLHDIGEIQAIDATGVDRLQTILTDKGHDWDALREELQFRELVLEAAVRNLRSERESHLNTRRRRSITHQ
ncbi:hypothetical protein [Halocatena salina]|uniref:Uncharacterized protein n=1 Tax=Halocatena salina TaxID=2934340 RepID=A0A8U0A8S5_9EURY|nr:hypothetical protein [Halocatena salina]UPM45236.1 hypothetical protein MW046_18075 [Halocatena salina]